MTYFSQDGFATNDVVGALAAALVHDLHDNNFTFTGFPSIEVTEESRTFIARLIYKGCHSPGLSISFSEGKALAKCFQSRKQIPQPWFSKIQDLIVDLERQTS